MAIVAVFALGSLIVVSCNKEEKNGNVEKNMCKKQAEYPGFTDDGIVFAAVNEKGQIVYDVDIDELSKLLYEQTSSYVLETFEVLDSIPDEKTGEVEVHMVVYNVKEGVPESYWFPIMKINNEYYYSLKSNGNGNGNNNNQRQIKCVPQETCKGGCLRKYDKDGRFLGCKCSGGDANCREGEFTTDIIESVGKAIARILAARFGFIF